MPYFPWASSCRILSILLQSCSDEKFTQSIAQHITYIQGRVLEYPSNYAGPWPRRHDWQQSVVASSHQPGRRSKVPAREVTVRPPCCRQTRSAAPTSCVCFRNYARTVALARNARSCPIQTVYPCIQMPARTRSSLLVWSLHACHSPRSSEIICDTRTVAVNPPDENQDDRSAWILLCFVCCLERTELSLNSFKTKLKTHFFSWPHLGYIYHLILFVVRDNAIIYKLARANVCIELNWINHVARTCFYHLRQLRVVRRSLTTNTAHSLVRALVHSRLDYCNGALAGMYQNQIDRLQSVLRTAARLVLSLPRWASVSDAMHDKLHWLPFPERVEFKLCSIVYKCLHDSAPRYLSQYCTPVAKLPGCSHLRSAAASGDLFVPATSTKTIGPRGFFHAGPTAWNCLPPSMKDPNITFSTFK